MMKVLVWAKVELLTLRPGEQFELFGVLHMERTIEVEEVLNEREIQAAAWLTIWNEFCLEARTGQLRLTPDVNQAGFIGKIDITAIVEANGD